MVIARFWQLVLAASCIATIAHATTPTRTLPHLARQNNNSPTPSNFVTIKDGQFYVNGSVIKFIGTNAYWLSALNSDEDIKHVFGNFSANKINLVRTWAFNDVEAIPEKGTWFQLISNGTTRINEGPNGIQKLDKIVQAAQDHGIYLIFSLTNNWNPDTVGPFKIPRRDKTGKLLARNALSNDYGGMDAYVRQFTKTREHSQFFVNSNIINSFKNYTSTIVRRYAKSPTILAWELANDPRCSSSLPATSDCNTLKVTTWHADVSEHVQTEDPNHIVSSGNHGFPCADCPKLFQRPPAPPPQVSPAPGQRRRSVPPPLTRSYLLKKRKELRKKKRSPVQAGQGIRVRGRWLASVHARQDDASLGSTFDGSQGVDSEDILSIPGIGFGTFQLFPDQNSYGLDSSSSFEDVLQAGNDWIKLQAESGLRTGKPVIATGFGLVTQQNAPSFVPFDSSSASVQDTAGSSTFGVTNEQRDQAYSQWFATGISAGLSGMMQYQWGQGNVAAQAGTAIVPVDNESNITPVNNESGITPNDGYSIQGVGSEDVQGVIQQAAQAIARTI